MSCCFTAPMRAVGAVIVVVALLSTAAHAGGGIIPIETDSLMAADQTKAPRVASMPYHEDFESLAPGRLDGQAGWFGQAGAKVVDSGIDLQSVVHRAPSAFGGAYLAMSSPRFDAGYARLDISVLIGSDQSTYFLETVSEPSRYINTRLRFSLDGSIQALQAEDGEPVFEHTLGSWSRGQSTRIGVEVVPSGQLFVYQDGETIFSGFDIATDHGQHTGIGRFSAFGEYHDTDDYLMVDNLTVPTPGGIVLALVSGVLFIGRRRMARLNTM